MVHGEFRPGGSGLEWCDAEVLRSLRRRSLAKLRKEVEPVPPEALARFLPQWQGLGTSSGRGVEALLRVLEQLNGVPVPASALETLVLPSRVAGYSPSMLDELTASGEVLWAGGGSLPGNDGWVSLLLADSADLLLRPPTTYSGTPLHDSVLEALDGGHALFFRSLSDRVGSLDDTALQAALWDLVWAGRRHQRHAAAAAHAAGQRQDVALAQEGPGAAALPLRPAGHADPVRPAHRPPAAGRCCPDRDSDATRRTHALAEVLLDRHGIVTRGAVMAERVPGGFAGVYAVLKAFEEAGRVRRGYFVEGLGAAQFAAAGAVDRMRALAAEKPREAEPLWTTPVPGGWEGGQRFDARPQRQRRDEARAVVLAATDPANPYGAALPWPPQESGHRPGRKAGALVVLVDGALVLYVERGGRTLLSLRRDRELPPARRRRARPRGPRRCARQADRREGRRRAGPHERAGPGPGDGGFRRRAGLRLRA